MSTRPSLLLRLERGMSECSMLDHIKYVHTSLYSFSARNHQQHPPLIKLQIFSHFSKRPFEFTKHVVDALILALRYCQVDLDFDFFQDSVELSRLLEAMNHPNSMISLQSIRLIGICHHPTSVWNFIATSQQLKRIHVTIRANEASLTPLCEALYKNQSLEMISICCYHKHCILEDTFWKSIQDLSKLTKLHVVGMDDTMLALVSKLAGGGGGGENETNSSQKLLLPTGLKDLQLSSLLGGALSPPAKTDGPIWTRFMCCLQNQTPNLQRLGLYSMQSLSTATLDDMLCHLPFGLKYLDLQGNYYIQSFYFRKWYQQLQQKETSSQLRRVNIGPQWLSHGFGEHEENDQMMDYLLTLFAKHLWLYQLGDDLECLLDKLQASYNKKKHKSHHHIQYQQDKEHLLTLADWNRSGSRHYARQVHSQQKPIPISLLPHVLQRMSLLEPTSGSTSSIAQQQQQRQASVLHMTLQESGFAHLLAIHGVASSRNSSV